MSQTTFFSTDNECFVFSVFFRREPRDRGCIATGGPVFKALSVYFELRVLQNYLKTYLQNAGNHVSEVSDFKMFQGGPLEKTHLRREQPNLQQSNLQHSDFGIDSPLVRQHIYV